MKKVLMGLGILLMIVAVGITVFLVVTTLFPKEEETVPKKVTMQPEETPTPTVEEEEEEQEPVVTEAQAIEAIRQENPNAGFDNLKERALTHQYSYNKEIAVEGDPDGSFGYIWLNDPTAFDIVCNIVHQYCEVNNVDELSFMCDPDVLSVDFVGDHIATVYNEDTTLIIAYNYTVEEYVGYIKDIIERE